MQGTWIPILLSKKTEERPKPGVSQQVIFFKRLVYLFEKECM